MTTSTFRILPSNTSGSRDVWWGDTKIGEIDRNGKYTGGIVGEDGTITWPAPAQPSWWDSIKDWLAPDPSAPTPSITPGIRGEIDQLTRPSYAQGISDDVYMHFAESFGLVEPRDPLVLDLDGDGIETVGISSGNPILFDHDADGVRTGTGWISADDGLLVLDRDGDGAITSGRELFGDNTLLANGETAANGYDALSELDDNSDGVINATDAAYSELRVWQDANQDGVVQTGELKSLAAVGVASIGVEGQVSDIDLGNGNTQPFSGSYTRIDGTTGTSGVAQLTGSLLLASNNFYREFTDDPAVTQLAATLPQMGGSGWARDLREAMSLGTDSAQLLQLRVAQFASASTRDEQMGLIDQVLSDWAATTGKKVNSVYSYNLVHNSDGALVTTDLTSQTMGDIVLRLHPQGMETEERNEFLQHLNVLEVFNGEKFIQLTLQATSGGTGSTSGSGGGGGSGTVAGASYVDVNLSSEKTNLLIQSYAALRESVYESLALQTRLRPYLDSVEVEISNGAVVLHTTGMAALLDAKHGGSEREAVIDLIELNRFIQPIFVLGNFDGMGKLQTWIDALPPGSPLLTELQSLGVYQSGSNAGSAYSDLYFGDAGGNSFSGGGGDDAMQGAGGDDTLQGGAGSDTFNAGAGNDVMSGEGHNTFHGWYTGGGDDTYLFGIGDGQDLIYEHDNAEGNHDTVIFKAGVSPADVKVTRSGDHLVLRIAGTTDKLTIHNYFAQDGASGWSVETIRFQGDPGVVWSVEDVKALAIEGTSGNDSLVGYASDDVINAAAGDDTANGAGGADTLNGQLGADSLFGGAGHDVLDGGADADNLRGEAGNDTLLGGDADDVVQGGDGEDVLDGGEGSDVLVGGTYDAYWNTYTGNGADTYLFGRGDGADSVYDVGSTAGVVDKIMFKPGVSPSDVQLIRLQGSLDLIIQVAGTSDRITVTNYFSGDGYGGWAIEEIGFSDDPSITWSLADIKMMVLAGTASSDYLQGYDGDDVINAGSGSDTIIGKAGADSLVGANGADSLSGDDGNDSLYGGADTDNLQGGNGDDLMDGGAGSDTLVGGFHDGYWNTYTGTGADTYLFGRGDGQDTVYDNDGSAGVVDKVVFKAGVLPEDVQVIRSSTDLVLKIAGTSDQVTIKDYFTNDASSSWTVEEIRFSDDMSTVWTVATVKALAIAGTAAADYLEGYASDDVVNAGSGNDRVLGNAGVDTLNGEDGIDTLSGGGGADSLHGGIGADVLAGDDGNDGLYGGADSDNLQGGNGNDLMDGGAGSDTLVGGTHDGYWNTYTGIGSDTYLFGRGDGQDLIFDNDSSAGAVDRIVFKAGVLPEDVQASRSGNDLVLRIVGTTDQVMISNYFLNDAAGGWTVEEICFTDAPGITWSIADVKSKVALSGTTGNDTLVGYASSDAMWGSAGNDSISGRAGNDTLNGEAGADTLYGEGGNDSLNGGTESDNLQGGADNDVLDGGAGNDTLVGGTYDGYSNTYTGTGADTYLFGRGDGQDTLYDNDGSAGVLDKLVFKTGVLPANVQVTRSTTDLVLKIAGTSDQVTIKNYFTNDASSSWTVEEIRFSDDVATVWTVATVKAMAIAGTSAADYLEGYASNDVINAGSGNDRVIGNAGADALNGDDGVDTLSGGAGADSLHGGSGVDTLAGDDGNDSLYGGADNDNLQGGNSDDLMDGGAGNDTLVGGFHDGYWNTYNGSGSDTYLFGRGDGQDQVFDNDGSVGVTDKVVFKAGVVPADVQVVRPIGSTNLVLKISGTSDQLILVNYFVNDANSSWLVEEIRFTDAPSTVWTAADVKALAIAGTAAADNLEGYASDDVINAGSGNDRVIGNAGADALNGEDGVDTLSGGNGADTLRGGSGADAIAGDDGNDTLYGEADNDTVQGGNGNDAMDGGAGSDTLVGGTYDAYWGTYSGAGADTYMFGRGNGVDVVFDNDGSVGVVDTVVFKAGVLPSDVEVVRPSGSNNLLLKITGTSDQLFIAQYFANDASNSWLVEEIRFTDSPSTVWTVADVKALALIGGSGADVLVGYASADTMAGNGGNDAITGGVGNDTIDGGAGVDSIQGQDGNDSLIGGADGDDLRGGSGNDTIDGGTGNDVLMGGVYDAYSNVYGGAGADVYLFAPGGGQDTVYDNDGTTGVLDSLKFGVGVAEDQLWFRRVNNNLEVSIIGTTDKVTVANWYVSASWHVEAFELADGQRLSNTDVQDLVQAMAGFAPPAIGQTTLPENYQVALVGVIAENWQ